MVWKSKYTTAHYEHGKTRLKRCFALLPVRMSDDNKVWLGFYDILQQYQITATNATLDGIETTFTNGQWVGLSKRSV